MELRAYSPITWLFERVFRFLQFLPPQGLAGRFHGFRSELSMAHVRSRRRSAERSKSVERWIGAYAILDGVAFASCFGWGRGAQIVASIWAVLRVIDIVQATVNVTLFDRLRGRADNRVASRSRLVVLGFLNFGELIVCFATIYGASWHLLKGAFTSPWDALYFSVVTQLTIGYGDLTPTGILRLVVVAQGMSGLAFLALVFARTITALPQIEEVIEPPRKSRSRARAPRPDPTATLH